jgi:hypothetical protein
VNRNDDSYRARAHEFTSVDCDWVRDNVPAHVLGALESDDSDRIETHALLCAECDREIGQWRQTGALLGAAVPQSDPPAAIKRNLMAAIVAQPDQLATPKPAVPPLRGTRTVPAMVNRRGWPSGRQLAMPLLCAVLVLGLWTINSQRDLGSQRNEIDRLERQNEALTVHLSSLQAGQQYFGTTGTWYPLSSVDSAAGEAGGIVMSGSQDTTTLLSVWNMPNEHESYNVLCESKRGEILSAGAIQVNERGNGTVTLDLPVPVTEYRAVHVVPFGTTTDADILTKDILQLLFGEPTAIAEET